MPVLALRGSTRTSVVPVTPAVPPLADVATETPGCSVLTSETYAVEDGRERPVCVVASWTSSSELWPSGRETVAPYVVWLGVPLRYVSCEALSASAASERNEWLSVTFVLKPGG